MSVEVSQMKDKNGVESNGGDQAGEDHVVSVPTPLSLLISKQRDFLLSPSGSQVQVSDLAGKVVALYFSANWYPPCRDFNQLLIETYHRLGQTAPFRFEVVFVSSDEDLHAFSDYYSTMPWLSIPFSDLNSKRELSRTFEVEGIPCLVILQPHSGCKEGVRDGVEAVYRYGAEGFPFSRERLEELERQRHESQTLVKLLTNHDRDLLLSHPASVTVPVGSIIGKTVGLYFSAQWCLPGVKFTPKLMSVYRNVREYLVLKGGNEDFEIVLVSSDRDQDEFDSHFNPMPWLALPFGDANIKDLTKYFDIRGIPCLVIVGPDGKTVTKHGRSLINLYEEDAYPFTAGQVELLECKMEEEAKNLPRFEKHAGHAHELTLVSEGSGGGPFICCDCDEQGYGWAYQCIDCGYEVHTKCVRNADGGPPPSESV